MAYESWGAVLRSSVALTGSVMTRFFICVIMSRSCGAGRVLRVLEMASGQVRLGGTSTPGGRGGKPFVTGALEDGGPKVLLVEG